LIFPQIPKLPLQQFDISAVCEIADLQNNFSKILSFSPFA